MPKAYWVATYHKINDPEKLAAYAKLAARRCSPPARSSSPAGCR
jgi:hypothetical protein